MAPLWIRVLGRLPTGCVTRLSTLQWKHPLFKRGYDVAVRALTRQDGQIQRGAGAGLRFNATGANAGYLFGSTEPAVQQVLATLIKPGMTVHDVGANVGFYSVIAARLVGATGQVVAFEPLPENARQIQYNAGLNSFANLHVRCEALGADDGAARFDRSAVHSHGRLHSVGRPPDSPAGEIEVQVRQLDSLLRNGLSPPDLIKIDVEGAEPDVLQGAWDTLRTYRPVLIVELHGTNRSVAALLQAAGYVALAVRSGASILESPWDVHVVALPAESCRSEATLRAICCGDCG